LDRPLADYYITNITDGWVPFTAVIEMTAMVERRQFGGRSLVYLPKYARCDDPVFGLSDDQIRARFLAALEQMYPHFRRESVRAFRVSRVRSLMAVPTLHYSERLPPVKTSIEGLFTVNGAQILQGTFNVNETIRLAEQTVRHILLPESRLGQTEPQPTSSHVAADCQPVAGP